MSEFDNINGIYAKDVTLREGITTLRNTVTSQTIKPLTVTQNGTYTADPSEGTYGYSPVTVDVNVPAPAIVTKHIRGNGIFSAADDNVAGYSDVIVDGSPDAAFFNIITLTDPAKLKIKTRTDAKNYTGDFLITWGDGSENTSITTASDGFISHTYPSVGTYGIMLYPIDASFKTYGIQNFGGYTGFGNATNEYVRISNAVVSLIENNGWFYAGRDFKSVSVPDSVTKLAGGIFANNSNLKTVYMRSTTPPTFPQDSWAYDPFYGANLTAIYVPASAVSAYKAASGWSTYANIIQPMPL